MRLGIVPRIVIVASCFWMAGATFFIAQRISNDADAAATKFYDECERVLPGANCLTGRDDIYRAHTDAIQGGLWGFAAGEAAILLVLGLIVLGVTYGSVKWILAGGKNTRS